MASLSKKCGPPSLMTSIDRDEHEEEVLGRSSKRDAYVEEVLRRSREHVAYLEQVSEYLVGESPGSGARPSMSPN